MHLGGKKQAETPKYKRKKETEAEVLALFPTMLPGSLWECTEEELPVQDLLQIDHMGINITPLVVNSSQK